MIKSKLKAMHYRISSSVVLSPNVAFTNVLNPKPQTPTP